MNNCTTKAEKEVVGYIYKTTNLINGKIYVGLHRNTEFNEKYFGSGKVFLIALRKYGKENFKCEVLEWCFDFEELNTKEIYWISHLNAIDREVGYNLSNGGDGVNIDLAGKNNPYFGKKHVEDVIVKMSGINHSFSKQVMAILPDGKQKKYGSINQASKEYGIPYAVLNDGVNKYNNHNGYYINRKTKIKFKIVGDNKLNPNKPTGVKYFCKSVLSVLPNGEKVVYNSIREASRATGISYNTLTAGLKDDWYINTKTNIKFKRI